jgi:outer membrane protein assembly factor BamD (BamD/ComL family)
MIALMSCAVTKDYERAVSTNSITAYENYLREFPNSKYRVDVNSRLQKLYDEQAWKLAISSNTIYGFKNYLTKYPDGKHVADARKNIEKIERQNEIDNAWNRAKKENSIEGYQAFIYLYPSSSNVYDAKSKIRNLQEENAWKLAKDYNSIDSYSEYLKKYPGGKYSSTANSKIEKIREEKIILPIWNETIRKNTYQAYRDFISKYPSSSYAYDAQNEMEKIERRDWDKACRTNTIKSYKDYILKYPYGEYVETADKKIIDLEVDNIFKGDYGQLPPMSKSSYGYSSQSLTNSIDIYNNTEYTLTIRYSGVESKKIVLSPQKRTTISLKNGNYRIAASVNASNVRNYAGTENLTGGDYNSEYYIQTQTFRTWGY